VVGTRGINVTAQSIGIVCTRIAEDGLDEKRREHDGTASSTTMELARLTSKRVAGRVWCNPFWRSETCSGFSLLQKRFWEGKGRDGVLFARYPDGSFTDIGWHARAVRFSRRIDETCSILLPLDVILPLSKRAGTKKNSIVEISCMYVDHRKWTSAHYDGPSFVALATCCTLTLRRVSRPEVHTSRQGCTIAKYTRLAVFRYCIIRTLMHDPSAPESREPRVQL